MGQSRRFNEVSSRVRGVTVDGGRFNRAATAPAMSYVSLCLRVRRDVILFLTRKVGTGRWRSDAPTPAQAVRYRYNAVWYREIGRVIGVIKEFIRLN